MITTVFAREGINVRTGARVEAASAEAGGGVRLALANGGAVTADRLLVAVGRVPVPAGLDLAAVGVRVDDRGYVRTDDRLATTAPGVYAAGDVTGRLPFTHAAFEMGRVAAGNALTRSQKRYRPHATPWVTFTDPEVARVGLAEAEAAGSSGRVAYLPMATRMFAGRLAATTHAYPTWSSSVQLAAAQLFMPVGGRHARRARAAPADNR